MTPPVIVRRTPFVIARSASDEAISEVGMRLPRFARNDNKEE